MPRFAATLAALACVLGAAPARAVEGVRVLDPVPGAVRFVVTVPPPELTPVAAAPGAAAATRLDIDGWPAAAAPGGITLPSRIVAVAVPPAGAVSVTATATGATVHDGVTLAADAGAASVPSAAIARVVDVGWMRHQRIARIELRPAAWDAAARRLVTYARLDVDVAVAVVAPAAAPRDTDAFEPVYRAALVDYEQGRGWRGRAPPSHAAARAVPRLAAAAAAPRAVAGRRWVKVEVRRAGWYRVPYSAFRDLAPFAIAGAVAADSVRLFAWSGPPVLPESATCDTCGLREVAIGIVDDDGRMDRADDAIEFYAVGTDDWADRFDAAAPDTVFASHPYATHTTYFLGLGTALEPFTGARRRIATREVAPSSGLPVAATFPARLHAEQDSPNLYEPNIHPGTSSYAWDRWFWAMLGAGEHVTLGFDLPGADTTQAARVRVRTWGTPVGLCADARQSLGATWNAAPLGAPIEWRGTAGRTIDAAAAAVRRRGNALVLTAGAIPCGRRIALSWADVFYARTFEPADDRLEFRPPSGGGALRYELGPFAAAEPPRLFDVTDPFTPVELVGAVYAAGAAGHVLAFASVDDDHRRYAVLPHAAFGAPGPADVVSATVATLDDLRAPAQAADYLVVCDDALRAAADVLAEWRRTHDHFTTKVVPVSAIYDQFSGGRVDPTAIRDFLRAAYDGWSVPPVYVTLLGDASYDFKNLLGLPASSRAGGGVPTYENGFDSRQFATDDWLLNVDDSRVVVPDFLGGRLPLPDAASALQVVRDKLVAYERAAPPGVWRDRMMLIADDDMQGQLPDLLGWRHVRQTYELDTRSVPSAIDRDYVYLHRYRTTPAFTKPDAHDRIESQIQGGGVAIVNFIGHGSPVKISDESVLTADDAAALTNAAKLPLFVAASCDVGRFDDPLVANTSMGERLLLNPHGGAIGVITATDETFSDPNSRLNRTIYESLFARPAGGVAQAVAIGKATAAAASAYDGANAQRYLLLGDAALRLALPRDWVEVAVQDTAATDTVTITQGRSIAFTGAVRTAPGGGLVAFDGTADVLVEDSKPRLVTEALGGEPFLAAAGTIYRGSVEVRGGRFSGRCVVPLEARPGALGRIRVYVAGAAPGAPATDGAGDQTLTVAAGTAGGGVDDRGPDIRLAFPNGATRVGPAAPLRIELADSSGILTTGHAPQNGIIVTLDGNTTSRVEVTDGFRYAPGSWQAGTVTFPLPNLATGPHVIEVSAADNLAVGLTGGRHRSHASLAFDVVDAPPVRVLGAWLFPDPVGSGPPRSGGAFVLDTEGGVVDAQLRVFTVAGRLVRTLRGAGEGQLQLGWDGLDAEGQPLANGVYVFKAVVAEPGGGRHADATGRFAVVHGAR